MGKSCVSHGVLVLTGRRGHLPGEPEFPGNLSFWSSGSLHTLYTPQSLPKGTVLPPLSGVVAFGVRCPTMGASLAVREKIEHKTEVARN